MNAFDRNPRLLALAMVGAGAAAIAIVLAINGAGGSGRAANKAIILIGLGGAGVGVGLVKLLWPPPAKTDEQDDRTFFGRASWPQRTLYILGGLVGVVAAAILQVWSSGKI